MKHIGFLVYDLQPFTEDCIYRISERLSPHQLKAYPVLSHPNQDNSRIPFLPSRQKGRHFGVRGTSATPEGFMSNINLQAAWHCVSKSDIVVFFGLQGATALFAAVLGKLFGRTMISVNQTLPVEWERKRKWWVKLLKKFLLGSCQLHVFQTPAAREVLLEVYKVQETALYFAPFEAGGRLFKQQLSTVKRTRDEVLSTLQIPSNNIVYLFVGNLVPFKGVIDLMQAMALLPVEMNVVAAFAGPEEPKCKEGGTISFFSTISEELGIKDKVRFTGKLEIKKLAELYHAADVVVLPTHKDCFPKVFIEGGLASKPIITTSACGAVNAIVKTGQNGIVIEPGDIANLAQAMKTLSDPALRKEMGNKSLELVNSWCDPEQETKGFVQAIKAAICARN